MSRLGENLAAIREEIAAAAVRSGRSATDVRLVGVTKYVSADVTRELVAAGLTDLAESRPQALWEKAAELADLPIVWHFVGHLQRNKARRTLPHIALLHSGDNLRLLQELNAEAALAGRELDVLLEVNISGDVAKHGFSASELSTVLPTIAQLASLRIRGLMTMAALEGGPDRARGDFAALRELQDSLRSDCPPTIELAELSMGMSGDFEEAIEEGATMVRVGSSLFAGISDL